MRSNSSARRHRRLREVRKHTYTRYERRTAIARRGVNFILGNSA